MLRFLQFFSLASATLILASCATAPTPNLTRLYADSDPLLPQPPVIVIPGILGSRLADDKGHEHWPGSLFKFIFGNYDGLALNIDAKTLEPIDDGLVATDVAREAFGVKIYGEIIRTLEQHGRYEKGNIGERIKLRRRRYYVFPYDWRQDNVVTVKKLDAFIKQLKQDYNDPTLKVDIIAHSMGGLITRYYSRYGTQDVLDDNDFPVNMAGAANIRKAILLGTPNLGSVKALQGFIKGYEIELQSVSTETLATMPSAYQLLPHPINDWILNHNGEALDRDLFSARLWQRFEWSIHHPDIKAKIIKQRGEAHYHTLSRYFEKRLERARRFVWSLTVPLQQTPVKFVMFGGTCQLTPARAIVEEVNGESVLRLYPEELENPLPSVDYNALMLEPGDGTVTKASFLARDKLDPTAPRHRYSFFPMAYSFFLCEGHETLTGNINFQDNLLNILLERSHGSIDRDRKMQR